MTLRISVEQRQLQGPQTPSSNHKDGEKGHTGSVAAPTQNSLMSPPPAAGWPFAPCFLSGSNKPNCTHRERQMNSFFAFSNTFTLFTSNCELVTRLFDLFMNFHIFGHCYYHSHFLALVFLVIDVFLALPKIFGVLTSL